MILHVPPDDTSPSEQADLYELVPDPPFGIAAQGLDPQTSASADHEEAVQVRATRPEYPGCAHDSTHVLPDATSPSLQEVV